MADAHEFLAALFDPAPPDTFVNLSGYVGSNGKREWSDKVGVFRVADIASIDVPGDVDRWMTIAPRNEPKRGSEGNAAGVTTVFADFDFVGSSDGKNPDRSFRTEQDVWDFLRETVPLAPSAAVRSGHGVHVYWFLNEMLEPVIGKELMVRMSADLRAKADVAGRDIDSMKDLSRVMRLPGSMNTKNPDDPKPVELIVLRPDQRYSFDDFDYLPDVSGVSVNPDTSHIPETEIAAWEGMLTGGRGSIEPYVSEMQGAVEGHPDSGRRPTAMTVLGKAANAAIDGTLDWFEATAAVGDVFVSMFPAEKANAAREFATMMNRVIKYRIAAGEYPEQVFTVTPPKIDVPKLAGVPIEAFKASDLDMLADQPVDFLIRGILAKGTYGMAGGAYKTLKTEFMMMADMAVATGQPLLCDTSFPVTTQGPVLTLVGEGGLAPYARRVSEFYGIDPPDNYIISGEIGDMSDDAFMERIVATIEEVEPVLFRIDPFYAYHGGETDPRDIFQQGKLLSRFLGATGTDVTFMLTHHFNETGSGLAFGTICTSRRSAMVRFLDTTHPPRRTQPRRREVLARSQSRIETMGRTALRNRCEPRHFRSLHSLPHNSPGMGHPTCVVRLIERMGPKIKRQVQ